ncbi:MAG TPA: saccharopine dehydrogenase NADP-binding domain-containing protein [Ktedonobacterales bacterium]|nr:saccharopine dehydrogenase NADP-binding domain-containing protein [Ktedonobacterales bacterium]
MHIVVLGGGGAMGRITVRALAEDARVQRVTVADLGEAAAQKTIDWLEQGRGKAVATACDVRDADGLAKLLGGADVVLNATDYPFNLDVMRAALTAKISYADLGGLFHMTRKQYELHGAFAEAGLTAVLGIGSTPGITNILARVAADQLDTVERLDVRIGSADLRGGDMPFAPPYSIRTILDECSLEPMVFADGETHAVAPLTGQEAIAFPAPVGQMTAMYTLHSEVALFPVSFGERGLRHASFKIAFPPEFLDQLRLLVDLGIANTAPLAVRGARKGQTVQVAPREVLVALLQQRASTLPPGEPNDCDVLRVVATGTQGDVPMELTEEMVVLPYKPWSIGAGDLDTGVPLAIAGILLASGEARLPGAHGAERVFDPAAFLRELARYGMHAHETLTRTIS